MRFLLLGLTILALSACGQRTIPSTTPGEQKDITILEASKSSCEKLETWNGQEPLAYLEANHKMVIFAENRITELDLVSNSVVYVTEMQLQVGSACTISIKDGQIQAVNYPPPACIPVFHSCP